MSGDKVVNVVICGGGLFGLALARQLHMQRPDLSIMVLERLTRPLPEAAFKVGESTTEQAAFYFAEVLGLKDYLETRQFEKLGLRYFYGDSQGDFARRPEYGVKSWLPAKSYQLDRGLLEGHLRELVGVSVVDLREGVRVQDIVINPGDEPHQVIYTDADGTTQSLRANWQPSSLSFDFIDYIEDVPTLTRQYLRNLPPRNPDFDTIIDNLRDAIDRMEEFAQVVFFLAVEDTMPEKLAMFEGNRWVNVATISLNSERWIEDGLFEPDTEPRSLDAMEAEIRSLFVFKSAAEVVVGR